MQLNIQILDEGSVCYGGFVAGKVWWNRLLKRNNTDCVEIQGNAECNSDNLT